MPYEISKKGTKYFVQNKMTGKVMGHHDTKKEAVSQMKAINTEEYGIRQDLKAATSVFMTGLPKQEPEHDEID